MLSLSRFTPRLSNLSRIQCTRLLSGSIISPNPPSLNDHYRIQPIGPPQLNLNAGTPKSVLLIGDNKRALYPFGSRAASISSSGSSSNTGDNGKSDELVPNFKWDVVEDLLPSKPELTGSILPFSELNFFQVLVFPYTYMVMYYMDFLLNYTPWWVAIVATTATVRLAFFPLVWKQNVIGIKIYNIMPETQKLQVQINEAMCQGDEYKAALNKTKLKLLYAEHDVKVWSRIWPIFVQVPMFMSIFFLLRKLAYHPVEGLSTGGALWFTNLTIPDPYFILPIMTCTSMFLLMEYGLEGSSGPMKTMGPIARWGFRALPLITFAFVHSFPSAVLLFWTTNNMFTLSYALLLKTKFVKKMFNIPARLEHDLSSLPLTNQTFSGQVKSAIDQGKSRRTTLDVRRLDDIAFRKAGVGPLKKTYKSPPPRVDE